MITIHAHILHCRHYFSHFLSYFVINLSFYHYPSPFFFWLIMLLILFRFSLFALWSPFSPFICIVTLCRLSSYLLLKASLCRPSFSLVFFLLARPSFIHSLLRTSDFCHLHSFSVSYYPSVVPFFLPVRPHTFTVYHFHSLTHPPTHSLTTASLSLPCLCQPRSLLSIQGSIHQPKKSWDLISHFPAQDKSKSK